MDLQASASGYGGGGYGYIQEEECPEGINVNLALLLIGAAIAAAATALFFQVGLQRLPKSRYENLVSVQFRDPDSFALYCTIKPIKHKCPIQIFT